MYARFPHTPLQKIVFSGLNTRVGVFSSKFADFNANQMCVSC